MTVRDLIDGLQKLISENEAVAAMPVLTEGCDCYGRAISVATDTDSSGPYVWIARSQE